MALGPHAQLGPQRLRREHRPDGVDAEHALHPLGVNLFEGALRVLRAIAATNGGAFEADEITLGGRGGDEREAASARASVGELLAPSQRATTLTLWALWSCFGFSYYGVVLLISEAFNNASGDDDTSCSGFNYAFLFVVATAEGVGDAIAMLCIDTFGRRRLQVLAYLVTALATIVLAVGVGGGEMSSGARARANSWFGTA